MLVFFLFQVLMVKYIIWSEIRRNMLNMMNKMDLVLIVEFQDIMCGRYYIKEAQHTSFMLYNASLRLKAAFLPWFIHFMETFLEI